jgi:hypothetical protein
LEKPRWEGPTGLEPETNIVWLDLKGARVKDEEFVNIAKEEGSTCLMAE